MNPRVKEDIISVLGEAISILEEERYTDLLELSNHTIHNSTIYQDGDSISVATLIYAMAKILQRHSEKGEKPPNILPYLKLADDYLLSDDEGKFRDSISDLFKILGRIDSKLKLYIQQVIGEAKVKKGCKLCEHGISVGRTAEILGITQWELLDYIGNLDKKLIDPLPAKNMPARLKLARSIFQ